MLNKLLKNKIVLLVLLVLVVIGLYFGLSKENDSKAIRIAVMGEPSSLDPNILQGGAWEQNVLQDSFTGLYQLSADGKVIPGMAESYTVSKNGLVYTFKLVDAKWSDGVPVTAYDFEYSYKRMLDPKTPAPYAYYHFDIKNAEKYKEGKVSSDQLGVKALDDKTLQITLEHPVGYFISTLWHDSTYPIPKHVVEKYGKDWSKPEHIVTNGAYKIIEWKPKSYIKAVKNDQYSDIANVKIEEIIYYTQEDRSAILKRFRAGEIDIADDFPLEQYEWLKANLPEETKINPYNALFYLSLNVQKPVLQDVRVRKALAMAIDREFIVDKVLKTGEIASYSFVSIGMGYDPSKFDFSKMTKEERLDKARKLLKEAGYTKENPLKLELAYTTDENDKKVLVAVSSMWKDIGVQVTNTTREVLIHYQELQNANFDIGRARWIGDYEDPATFLELYASNVGNNYGKYSNAKFDDLFVKAKSTLNAKERVKLYSQAEEMLLNDVPAIPLFYFVSHSLVSQRVIGWKPNTSNFHAVKYMSLKDMK